MAVRARRAANPERTREAGRNDSRKYLAKHHDEILEKRRKQYGANPGPARARGRQYHAEHREEINERARKWYAENPERGREIKRKWYARNREKVLATAREHYAKNPTLQREIYLKKEHGLTPTQYDAMNVAQQGHCKVCGRDDQRLHVDHDHTTGLIRGLLCGNCNRMVGLAGDDPAVLRQAADYIEQSTVST